MRDLLYILSASFSHPYFYHLLTISSRRVIISILQNLAQQLANFFHQRDVVLTDADISIKRLSNNITRRAFRQGCSPRFCNGCRASTRILRLRDHTPHPGRDKNTSSGPHLDWNSRVNFNKKLRPRKRRCGAPLGLNNPPSLFCARYHSWHSSQPSTKAAVKNSITGHITLPPTLPDWCFYFNNGHISWCWVECPTHEH